MIKLAHRESPFDSKDLVFNNSKPGFVKLASNNSLDYKLPQSTPISNQGVLSSCAPNASADAAELLMGIQDSKSVKQLSRLFIYYNARNAIGEVDKDAGCYIKDCFKSMSTLGICEESLWSYDELKVFAQPTLFAYASANDNKINNYYRINEDSNKLDNIELAIRSNHPVVFGTVVSEEFTSCGSFDEYPIFSKPKSNKGAHAMIILGVKYIDGKRHFVIRNSWGSLWGYAGTCLMTEDYINSEDTNDLWVPTLIPDII